MNENTTDLYEESVKDIIVDLIRLDEELNRIISLLQERFSKNKEDGS